MRECRELEEMCGVAFTDRLLKGELMWGKNLKEEIRRVDRAQLLDRCGLRALLIAQVQRRAGWVRLCDAALDYVVLHTRELQLLCRVLSHHGKGNHPCPLREVQYWLIIHVILLRYYTWYICCMFVIYLQLNLNICIFASFASLCIFE